MPDSRPLFAEHYRLIEEVARGGQGTVFSAWDPQCERMVAIKHRLDAVALAGEKRAAQLRHPSIATVYGVGCDGDQHYVVMEWISDPTLDVWAVRRFGPRAGRTPADIRLAFEIAAAVARALAVAHGRPDPVCHFDLKPSNIFVGSEGATLRVKVADFGLADTSGLGGTPSYMAPEQFGGRDAPFVAADIYALGCVLYELASGEPPFGIRGSYEELAAAHRDREPARPPAASDEQWRVLGRMLAKEPLHRFASPAALAEALTAARDRRLWPPVEPATALSWGVVGGGTLLGLSMVVGQATSYGSELNWSVNYLVVAPMAAYFGLTSMRMADEIVSVDGGPETKGRWQRFRAAMPRVVSVVALITIAVSVIGHLRRASEYVPAWATEPTLSVAASVAEGVFVGGYVAFLTCLGWAAPILASPIPGVDTTTSSGRERLAIQVAATASMLGVASWLSWVQEGAAQTGRTWLEYFGGRHAGSWSEWLTQTPPLSPYGGPLPIAAVTIAVAAIVTSAVVVPHAWLKGHQGRVNGLLVASVLLFPFVRLGAVCVVVALVVATQALRVAAKGHR